MTEAELAELLADCPVLYHVAEPGAWPTIRRHGLLSTRAILDLFGVAGAEREAVEARRRPAGVVLERADLGRFVVRDQRPLGDRALAACLTDGVSPAEWHRTLNGRVFFWLSPARVRTLLGAAAYRGRAHEVLELDAAPLVAAHRERIALSPINSGAAGRFPAPRGPRTFLPVAEYPYAELRRRRPRGERVVELTVEGAVPDAARFVRRVVAARDGTEVATVWERPVS